MIKTHDKETMICNIYAPNKDDPKFFADIIEETFDLCENKIYVGEFNLTTNSLIDRKGEKCNNEKACQFLNQTLEDMCLAEVWRDRNPGVKRYSYFRKCPSMASRIYFALVSKGKDAMVNTVFYVPASMTDHSAFYMNLQFTELTRGRGYWKFNDSHLKKMDFLKEMNEFLEHKLGVEYSHLEPKIKWKTIKFDISNKAQDWSKMYASDKRLIMAQLYEKLAELEEKM